MVFQSNTVDQGIRINETTVPMDDDEKTVQSGGSSTNIGPPDREILIRFQLPSTPTLSDARKLLTTSIQHVLSAFPGDITYIDDKGQEHIAFSSQIHDNLPRELEKSALTVHPVYVKKNHSSVSRWVSIIRFRSIIPFRDWKKHDDIYRNLRKQRIFMFPHNFGKNDWDIIGLGFLLGLHIVQCTRSAAKEYVQQLLSFNTNSTKDFHVVPSKIQAFKKKAYTRAFEIECKRQDGPELHKQLTSGAFRDPKNRLFVPYSMKRTNTLAFTKLVQENNQLISDSYVLKLEGIDRNNIHEITSKITSLSGVRFLIPTPETDTKGEWRVLIKSSKFYGVDGYIRQHWDEWCVDITSPLEFPPPAVTSRPTKSHKVQDDVSDDSYGTLLSTTSTLTGGSDHDTSDQFSSFPLDNPTPSYAEMLTNNIRIASPTSTITGSAAASKPPAIHTNHHGYGLPNDWQSENQRLRQEMKAQSDILQHIQQTKIELEQQFQFLTENIQSKECRTKELEDRIAQLLTIVSDRDQQMAERDMQIELRNQQFDMIMEKLNIQMETNSVSETPPSSQLALPHSTPTRANKRQNIQNTPIRSPPKTKHHDNHPPDRSKKQK